MAITLDCSKCLALLVSKDLDKDAYSFASLATVASYADANSVLLLLDHGANVNVVDPLGRTPLMYAAASDLQALDVVKLLLERGAGRQRQSFYQGRDTGQSVLDIAKLHGETPVVAWLVKSGAKATSLKTEEAGRRAENTIPTAIQEVFTAAAAGGRQFRSQGRLRFLLQQQGLEAMAWARRARTDSRWTRRSWASR